MEPPGAILQVQNLRKYFPVRGGLLQTVQAQVKAVDGVSFDVQGGEIVGLVGESGCGKSTLARLIQRLIEADAGTVAFEGQDILQHGPDRPQSLLSPGTDGLSGSLLLPESAHEY